VHQDRLAVVTEIPALSDDMKAGTTPKMAKKKFKVKGQNITNRKLELCRNYIKLVRIISFVYKYSICKAETSKRANIDIAYNLSCRSVSSLD